MSTAHATISGKVLFSNVLNAIETAFGTKLPDGAAVMHVDIGGDPRARRRIRAALKRKGYSFGRAKRGTLRILPRSVTSARASVPSVAKESK